MASLTDLKTKGYRAFVFVLHDDYGILLLRCNRKKKKPDHWQVPGGRIDDQEFELAASESDERVGQLLLASKVGAARELYEETGIDIRSELDRLLPPFLHPQTEDAMPNEFENRIYYFLIVTDADFSKSEDGTSQPMNTKVDSPCQHVRLRLSIEHCGYAFEVDMAKAAEDLTWHSGGKNSAALRMAMQIEHHDTPPDDKAEGKTLLAEKNHSIQDKEKLMCCFKRC